MKPRSNKKKSDADLKIRKDPSRRVACEHTLSNKMKRGGDRALPGDRGACETESETQGSE